MTTMTEARNKNSAFQLKGSLFTLTVLHLLKTDLDAINKQLAPMVKQTPKFFYYMPVVIDLQKLRSNDGTATIIDFQDLDACLRAHKLIPVGIRGGTPEQQEAALQAGLALLPNTKTETTDVTASLNSTPPPPQAVNQSRLITQPVRSGQQIYARNADLIVLAPVSHGAELLADGHIHVYGTLRGRALAGVNGDQNARIFCQSLEAELVAIAGHYWLSEDLQNSPLKQGVHVYLENERLHVGTL